MKNTKKIVFVIIFILVFSSNFIINNQFFSRKIKKIKSNYSGSNKLNISTENNLGQPRNDPFENLDKTKKDSNVEQKPVLISDLSDDSFLYHYQSNNYYGTLDITDYQPSKTCFHELQEPNNVNIKGIPWESSQFILTFVLPIYNKIDYLDRIFKSILDFANSPKNNPRNEKIEIVIVDAGSTDGSYEYALRLAKSLNNPSNRAVYPKSKHIKKDKNKEKQKNDFDSEDHNLINSVLTSFLTGNKYSNPKKTIRYRNAMITIHNQGLLKKIEDSNQKAPFHSKISLYQGSNVKVRVIRRNKETYSVIARQIGVEYSTGRYIWQVDPDDETITDSIAKIVDELRKEVEDPKTFVPNKDVSNTDNDFADVNDDKDSHKYDYIKNYQSFLNNDIERKNNNDPPADMVEIGYCQFTYENGVFPDTPNCFPKFEQRLNSNLKIAEQLVTYATSWQLWQCIIKRDTLLKAIETIKLRSPNQTKITFADDLFIYSATVYHAQVLKGVNLFGYIYYLNNPQSESLKISKGKLDTKLSWKIIVEFIHCLFDRMKLPYSYRYTDE
ncbi:hypothetical protein M9Y10_038095 [Tritrichomonas musculus]|uniref:Glycosyltransferase 2-like domain-containing protein n=1 Tax=Tritrichomonas musculus TaxID=1915356 RepID=A0ABR2K7K5_9EUKA